MLSALLRFINQKVWNIRLFVCRLFSIQRQTAKRLLGFYHDEQKQLVWDLHHQQPEKVEQEAKGRDASVLCGVDTGEISINCRRAGNL